jgi:hypothetical protein
MSHFGLTTAGDANLITAENRQSAQAGTALAINSDTLSCRLVPAAKGSWGGARNRADRVSETLTAGQCRKLIAATLFARSIGLPFNRHWIIHCEMAGIAGRDGAHFIGKVLNAAGKAAKRHGGQLAAIWVREHGIGKGEHAHILMHLPRGMILKNKTRRWIVGAGGAYRQGVSKVRSIGGSLLCAEAGNELYELNADNVLAYLLKHGDDRTAQLLGLPHFGHRGLIMGKRCGSTQNIADGAQAMHSFTVKPVGGGRIPLAIDRGTAGDPSPVR